MAILRLCPACFSPELEITSNVIAGSPNTAKCGHCGWEGLERDVDTALLSDTAHTTEELAEELMMLVLQHFTGPCVRVLEYRGLLPRKKTEHDGWSNERLKAYNDRVDEVRGDIVKHVTEKGIEALLLAAGEAHEKMRSLEDPS